MSHFFSYIFLFESGILFLKSNNEFEDVRFVFMDGILFWWWDFLFAVEGFGSRFDVNFIGDNFLVYADVLRFFLQVCDIASKNSFAPVAFIVNVEVGQPLQSAIFVVS